MKTNINKPIALVLGLLFLLSACNQTEKMKSKNGEGNVPAIKTFTLTNTAGNTVKITNFGAKVMSVKVPDKNGKRANVVLGYDTAEQYIDGNPYFGAIIGRYGNRIAGGKFELDGKKYQLAQNNGVNHLHGGPGGFHNVVWEAKKENAPEGERLRLHHTSPDGDESYPGKLDVEVVYTWTDDNELIIDYTAESDKKTIINLTHHSFFNLLDGGASTILDHQLWIDADQFTPVDSTLIPTGELRNVAGTAFDFRKMKAIGKDIGSENQQMNYGHGYDHNFVLNSPDTGTRIAAEIYEPKSGRLMKILTDQPGLQFYSGNFLDGSDTGHGKTVYEYRTAFCLEAQHFPDSPNQAAFPSTVLDKGETYRQQTVYQFDIREDIKE